MLEVLGMPVGDDAKVLDQVRKRVGMVFQNFNLFPHLTVLENCVIRRFGPSGAVVPPRLKRRTRTFAGCMSKST